MEPGRHKFAYKIFPILIRQHFLHQLHPHVRKSAFCVITHFFNLQNINLFIIKRVARRLHVWQKKYYNIFRAAAKRRISCPFRNCCCKILISDGVQLQMVENYQNRPWIPPRLEIIKMWPFLRKGFVFCLRSQKLARWPIHDEWNEPFFHKKKSENFQLTILIYLYVWQQTTVDK